MTSAQEIYQASIDLLNQGKSAALITIIQSTDSRCPVSARMLVRTDGSSLGDLGDERLTMRARELAQQAIAETQSLQASFWNRTGEWVQARANETGDVSIFIQALIASPTLLLIGAGHIGIAVIQLAKMLNWRVVVVDDRPDFITPARLPNANERVLAQYDPQTEVLAPLPITITPSTYILSATWGWDLPALRQIIDTPAAYIGLVASARKSIFIFRELIKQGISPEQLQRIRVPTGLDLGAETPAEIALSIMAEMLMVYRHATGIPLMQFKGSAIMAQSIRGG